MYGFPLSNKLPILCGWSIFFSCITLQLFLLVEGHCVSLRSVFQFVWFKLQSNFVCLGIGQNFQFCVISKQYKELINPASQVINKNVKENWPQDRFLLDPIDY